MKFPTRLGFRGRAICFFMVAGMLYPQADAPERRLNAREIARLKVQAESDTRVKEDVRSQVVAFYDQALDAIEKTKTFQAEAAQFDRSRAGVGREEAGLRRQVDSPPGDPRKEIPPNATAADLQDLLVEHRAQLETSRKTLREVEQFTDERTARRTNVARRLGELDRQMDALSDDLRTASDDAGHPALSRARRSSLLAQRAAAAAEKQRLRNQLALFEARGVLLPLQRDLAQRRVDYLSVLVSLLEQVAPEQQQREAGVRLEKIRALCREAMNRDPQLDLDKVAAETERYAKMLLGKTGVAEETDVVSRELTLARKHVSELDRIVELTRRRFAAAGPRANVSLWWPEVPDDFPTLAEVQSKIRERELLLPAVKHKLITLEEERAKVPELRLEVAKYVRSAAAPGPKLVGLRRTIRRLLVTRRDLLDDLIQQYGRYSNQLTELDTVSRGLERDGKAIVRFLYERLYWSPSVAEPFRPDFASMLGAFSWLSSADEWSAVGRHFLSKASQFPGMTIVRILLLASLLVFRRRIIRRLNELGDRVRNPDADSLTATLEATLHTLLLAAPLPGLLVGLSRFLESEASTTFTLSVNQGLYYLGLVAFLFEMTRQSLRPNGLAEAHFGRPAVVTRALYRALFWPEILFLPLMYVAIHLAAAGLQLSSPEQLQQFSNSLGRMAFILAMTILAASLFSVFRPRSVRGGGKKREEARKEFRYVSMAAYPCITFVVVAPLVLAVLGYYLTSYLLAYQFLRTALLILGLAILGGLLRRWRETGHHRMSELVRARMAEAPQAKAQLRQFSRFVVVVLAVFGLYSIWEGALPALSALKRVQVYPRFEILDATGAESLRASVTESAEPPQSTAATDEKNAAVPSPVPLPGREGGQPAPRENTGTVLTLWNLFQALLAGLITFVLVRDVPALIQLVLLRRTRLDAGARVAVSTLVRYALLIGGISVTFSMLGLSWSKIQWLAAALTFGLGFGLQEIVANFVSGLILLLERPIRVGDAVTIGNLQGRVSRIEIRATTVTLWDRSEMVVPNKEFITGKLVNWTLSDSRRRIDIAVRVAYGADVQRVKTTLLGVADAHPAIFRDPAPQALLLEFGEDAMKFELRFFVDFGRGLKTKAEVNEAIDRAFREAGVEFALPSLNIRVPQPAPAPPAADPE